MLNVYTKQLIGVGVFLFAIFVGMPLIISATGRWDFYFTLTSVALLSIASAGVSDSQLLFLSSFWFGFCVCYLAENRKFTCPN